MKSTNVTKIIVASATTIIFASTLIFIAGCGQKDLPQITGEFPNTVAENANISAEYKDIANDLSKDAIDIFMTEISGISRQSGNEMQMSNYIVDFAKMQGFQYTQLENGVVYFDVPASQGCEKLPKIILQSHLDMVVTTKDDNIDKNTFTPELYYDAQKGAIFNENYETNIGADDGEGIMTMLAISKNDKVKHGPLRMLFTVGEETDMDGARSVTADMLDADYLINIDGGPVGEMITSSAGCLQYSCTKKFASEIPNQKETMAIKISDLAGGHSGMTIGEKRQNAIKYFTE
ncbi:MAG: hypothetical protein MJ189_05650, partial [Coriobacteriales bacterium]|nr:hypothetical protein [Coriobacteriales bacterium]